MNLVKTLLGLIIMSLSSEATDFLAFVILVLSALTLPFAHRCFRPSPQTIRLATRVLFFHIWGAISILEINVGLTQNHFSNIGQILRDYLALAVASGLFSLAVLWHSVAQAKPIAFLQRGMGGAGIATITTVIFAMASPSLFVKYPAVTTVCFFILGAASFQLFYWGTAHTHALVRSLLYGINTFSILIWSLPRLVLVDHFVKPDLGSLITAGLLIIAASCIFMVSARALAHTGGTPDPWDPPKRLVTSGIYAYLRHPLHLAEILAALAALPLFMGTSSGAHVDLLFYVCVVALVIMGPWRWLEEFMLIESYGDKAQEYFHRVKSYGI